MIMKRFLLLCLLFVPCLAAQAETYRVEDIPNVQRADRTRYVSNPDGILSDEAVAHIDRLCAALRERAVAQVLSQRKNVSSLLFSFEGTSF